MLINNYFTLIKIHVILILSIGDDLYEENYCC